MSGGYYGGQRDSYMNGPPRMRYGNRMMSDGNMYNGQGRPYPHHGYQQSQDTMHTGVTNGSDSTGPWASGTDPSSENSSIDRNMAGGNGNGKLRHVRVALAVGRTRGVLTLPRLGYERRGKRDVALIYGAEFSEGHGRATP